MGGYSDFTMSPPGGGAIVAGVCHARGHNADLPPQWLIYVTVAAVLDQRLCVVARGTRVGGPCSERCSPPPRARSWTSTPAGHTRAIRLSRLPRIPISASAR